MTRVAPLGPTHEAEAVDVLCEAFGDYPVMRYVLDETTPDPSRLRTLVAFFVAARVLREEPLLGVRDRSGALAGVALVTLPGDRPGRERLAERRAVVWEALGPAARARYDAFGAAGRELAVAEPHHHLNMIGVRRAHLGQGLGRRLLEAVHRLSAADSGSAGVSLSTEDPKNVSLYLHFGYRLLGHARVAEGLETWQFFRPDPRGPAGSGATD